MLDLRRADVLKIDGQSSEVVVVTNSKTSIATNSLAIVSVLIAIASAFFSWQANSISREAFKRASGRTVPLFTVRCSDTHLLVINNRAEDPETLLVIFKNEGEDPIEAARFEILMDVTWTGDRAKNQSIKPTRVLHEFNRILQPGQTESIDIAPDVAAHIKTLEIPKGKESFWTRCLVTFSAKIVGGNYFASASDVNNSIASANHCSFGLTWKANTNVKMEPLNFGIDLNQIKQK